MLFIIIPGRLCHPSVCPAAYLHHLTHSHAPHPPLHACATSLPHKCSTPRLTHVPPQPITCAARSAGACTGQFAPSGTTPKTRFPGAGGCMGANLDIHVRVSMHSAARTQEHFTAHTRQHTSDSTHPAASMWQRAFHGTHSAARPQQDAMLRCLSPQPRRRAGSTDVLRAQADVCRVLRQCMACQPMHLQRRRDCGGRGMQLPVFPRACIP